MSHMQMFLRGLLLSEKDDKLPGVFLENFLGFLPAEVRGANKVCQKSGEGVY
jgi:hypothetical protein